MMTRTRFPGGRWALLLAVLPFVAGAGRFEQSLAKEVEEARQALEALGLEKLEIEAAGDRLVYFSGGDGPLLVLIHGAGDQAGTWASVVEALLAEYRLLIPDLPGHGESEPGQGPLPFGEVVTGFDIFLEMQVQTGSAILVGSSMGAWLATLQALDDPDRVSRVVAVNGGPITGNPNNPSLTPKTREEARQLMALLRDPDSPEVPDAVLDDIVERTNSGPLGRMLQAPTSFSEYLLDWRLAEISTPVDLVWGESDQVMDLDYAGRMLRGLPRARLTKVAKCGHIPQAECPERFVETLLTVLRSEPPPKAATEEEPDDPMEGENGDDSR